MLGFHEIGIAALGHDGDETAVSYVIDAGTGLFTLTGQAALGQYSLVATYGSYALAGQDVNILAARKLTAEHGAYVLNGQDVNLSHTGHLIVDTGVFTFTGNAVGVNVTMIVEHGSFTLAGQDVDLRVGAYSQWLTDASLSLTWTPEASL